MYSQQLLQSNPVQTQSLVHTLRPQEHRRLCYGLRHLHVSSLAQKHVEASYLPRGGSGWPSCPSSWLCYELTVVPSLHRPTMGWDSPGLLAYQELLAMGSVCVRWCSGQRFENVAPQHLYITLKLSWPTDLLQVEHKANESSLTFV